MQLAVVNSRNHAYPVIWMKVSAFCEFRGESKEAVQSRIDRGRWVEGQHFKVCDGVRYINVPEADRWVEKSK